MHHEKCQQDVSQEVSQLVLSNCLLSGAQVSRAPVSCRGPFLGGPHRRRAACSGTLCHPRRLCRCCLLAFAAAVMIPTFTLTLVPQVGRLQPLAPHLVRGSRLCHVALGTFQFLWRGFCIHWRRLISWDLPCCLSCCRRLRGFCDVFRRFRRRIGVARCCLSAGGKCLRGCLLEDCAPVG